MHNIELAIWGHIWGHLIFKASKDSERWHGIPAEKQTCQERVAVVPVLERQETLQAPEWPLRLEMDKFFMYFIISCIWGLSWKEQVPRISNLSNIMRKVIKFTLHANPYYLYSAGSVKVKLH